MTALQLADLTNMAEEPRISDRILSAALGFERPTRVRELVARHRSEMESYGDVFHRNVRRNAGQVGRTALEYYLNEAQALLVCMFARTPKAAEIRRQVIEVFMAWRRGVLQRVDQTQEVLVRLEARLEALEATGRPLERLIAAPSAPALALSHAAALWFDQARAVRPKFWGDVEVRGLLLGAYRQMTVDQARSHCVEVAGSERAPSRSAISRFWLRLDRLATAP